MKYICNSNFTLYLMIIKMEAIWLSFCWGKKACHLPFLTMECVLPKHLCYAAYLNHETLNCYKKGPFSSWHKSNALSICRIKCELYELYCTHRYASYGASEFSVELKGNWERNYQPIWELKRAKCEISDSVCIRFGGVK